MKIIEITCSELRVVADYCRGGCAFRYLLEEVVTFQTPQSLRFQLRNRYSRFLLTGLIALTE